MNYADRVPITKIWLGRQDLQFLEAVIQVEQETHRTAEGLF